MGSTKLNDISQKSLLDDNSKASVYLKNLTELGIIQREFSVDVGRKEQANSSRGLYRVANHFFRFWYSFVFANFSQLEEGDVEGVFRHMVEPELYGFASFAFEDICREFVRELQKKGQLPFWYAKMGKWIGKTTVRGGEGDKLRMAETEIDILAISREAKEYLVAECKFKNTPFSYGECLTAAAKLTPLKEGAKFYYALFSASGIDDKVIREAERSHFLYLYDLGDIVGFAR